MLLLSWLRRVLTLGDAAEPGHMSRRPGLERHATRASAAQRQ